jgi:hypothetical protein
MRSKDKKKVLSKTADRTKESHKVINGDVLIVAFAMKRLPLKILDSEGLEVFIPLRIQQKPSFREGTRLERIRTNFFTFGFSVLNLTELFTDWRR